MKVNELHLLQLAFLSKSNAKKCGFLYKKSGKRYTSPEDTSVRWQKRWCAVYCNFFFYYESETSVKPQGVIYLEGIGTEAFKFTDQGALHFSIEISQGEPHRRYLFGCDSSVDCEEWLQAIASASVHSLSEKNDNLVNTVIDLESHIQTLNDEKEKLRQELSDSYTQVSRLKLELSSVRNQAEFSRMSMHRKLSVTESVRGDDSGTCSGTSISDKEYSAEDIVKLIKLQNFVRWWLQQRRWKGLVKSYMETFTVEKLKRRNKLLWQFITAEEDYVQQMKVLINVFYSAMKQESFTKEPCISNAEVSKIYNNCESILVLHKIFVEGMASRMKNWPAVNIDDLLFAIVAAVPIYIEYIKNHPSALSTLAQCKKRRDFVKLLTWCEAKDECHGQTLEQLLLYPVRVMPTYIRNIYDILEVTPVEHNERKSLESIAFKLQEAQNYGNYLDEGDSIRHTLEIERLIDGGCRTLLQQNQKFIRHGVLKQVGMEPNLQSGKRDKVRHCFLFSQHLIIASRTVDGRLRLSRQSGEIPLAYATLLEEGSSSELSDYAKSTSFTLNVNSSSDSPKPNIFTVILKASKSSEKNLWTTDISQCIDNLALEDDEESVQGGDTTDTATLTIQSKTSYENEEGKHQIVSLKPYTLTYKDDARLRENADDIVYGNEVNGPYHLPQIIHASVGRLIERLADPRLPGAEFMETFLLTYRAFTTSEVVIKGLIEAYWDVMGGHPAQVKKTDSPERKKLAVSRSTSGRSGRMRTISNGSDVSSADDLDASYNSTISPYTSTTVFNYNTLKDQLNSPTKRKLATTKWCQDSAAVTAKENDLLLNKPRSISACNVNAGETTAPVSTPRKISRSQSVEVIVGKDELASNGSDALNVPHEFISAFNSRSCNHLVDSSSSFNDENKVHIISVSGVADSRPGMNTSVARDEHNIAILLTPPMKHRGSLLSEEISASEELRLKNHVEEENTNGEISMRTTEDHIDCVSRENTEISMSLTNSELSNSLSNHGETFRQRETSSSFTDHDEISSTSCTIDDESSRFFTNESLESAENDKRYPTMRSHKQALTTHTRYGEIFENGEIVEEEEEEESSAQHNDSIAEEVVDELGNVRNRSSITDSTVTSESVSLDRLSELGTLDSSRYSDSTLGHSYITGRSNTLDSNYTTDYDDRRSTMDSQLTDRSNTMDSTSGYLDVRGMDRSITTDSMNSFESGDVSMYERSNDSATESTASNVISCSYSDDMISNKNRCNSDSTVLPPTKSISSSYNEKKNSLTPIFRRKKKHRKDKDESTKSRSSSVPKDEPVLISIKDHDGHVILGRSISTCNDMKPAVDLHGNSNESSENTSVPVPIPIPTLKIDKPLPECPPRRKRSSLFAPFRKNPMKRASSEQNITPHGSVGREMRPAVSHINLNRNNSKSLKNSPTTTDHTFDNTNSLDRKKSFSLRDKFNSLTSSDLDLSIKGSIDGKSSLKKEKKRLKGSFKMNNILSSVPKEISETNIPSRRKTSVFDHTRTEMVPRRSISVNRGPLKIMSIFKHWLAKHPKDFVMDPVMTATLEKFFKDIRSDERTLPVVKEIVSSLEKSLNVHRQSLTTVHPFDELLLQQHSLRRGDHGNTNGIDEDNDLNRCSIIYNYPPNVVAANMTLLEHYLYAKIAFNEFVSCQWTKKDKDTKAPGIMKFIKRFNQVTSIISYGVVHGQTAERRGALIEFWIRTAAHCRDLNNFNAIIEIVSALNASAVHRLKKSWELVSRPLRNVFSDLDTLVSADRAFKNLREAVHMCNPPCVPYLGCYLSDLLFAHEGGATFNENGLVNHAKMCRVSRLVREVKCYQQLPYTIELNNEVAHSLVNWDVDVDQDKLYDQSLLAEPRAG